MTRELFRQQALLASRDSLHGERIIYQPVTVRVLSTVSILIAVAIAVFACLARISQTELVRGHLQRTSGMVKVYSPAAGVLQSVHAKEGEWVSRGQILATVVASSFDAEGAMATQTMLEQIDLQIEHLHEQSAVTRAQTETLLVDLQNRMERLRAELDLLALQQKVIDQRIELSAQEHRRAEQLLARNMLAESAYEAVLDQWYSVQQVGGNNRLQMEGRLQALADVHQQQVMAPLNLQRELLELQGNIAQLMSRRKEFEVGQEFAITAPQEGQVNNLLAVPGTHLDPRVPLLTLLDDAGELEALLYVPSRAVGKIDLLQQILVAYDAYPERVYGSYPATVTAIAESVVDPREFLFPLDVSEPVFLVKAAVADIQGQDLLESRLRSGMLLSARIVTGRETLMARMLSPLRRLDIAL